MACGLGTGGRVPYGVNVRIFAAKVVHGTIAIEGDPLPEGAKVTVVARDGAGDFTLSDEDEAELIARVASVDAGDTIDE
jgi:hypothetical protein